MVRFLEAHGFRVLRIRGSHHILAKGEMRSVVPVHGAEVRRIGTLRGVLRDTSISPDEFELLWARR